MIRLLIHSMHHNWLCIDFISFIVPPEQLKFIHPILLIHLYDYYVYKYTKKCIILRKYQFQLPNQLPNPHYILRLVFQSI